jgi:hypothetical protein
MNDIYAKSGEIMTCENGHYIAQIKHNITRGKAPSVEDFNWFSHVRKPAEYSVYAPCKCGADYITADERMHTIVHFDEGWRG